jgi:hypothetical protein
MRRTIAASLALAFVFAGTAQAAVPDSIPAVAEPVKAAVEQAPPVPAQSLPQTSPAPAADVASTVAQLNRQAGQSAAAVTAAVEPSAASVPARARPAARPVAVASAAAPTQRSSEPGRHRDEVATPPPPQRLANLPQLVPAATEPLPAVDPAEEEASAGAPEVPLDDAPAPAAQSSGAAGIASISLLFGAAALLVAAMGLAAPTRRTRLVDRGVRVKPALLALQLERPG